MLENEGTPLRCSATYGSEIGQPLSGRQRLYFLLGINDFPIEIVHQGYNEFGQQKCCNC